MAKQRIDWSTGKSKSLALIHQAAVVLGQIELKSVNPKVVEDLLDNARILRRSLFPRVRGADRRSTKPTKGA